MVLNCTHLHPSLLHSALLQPSQPSCYGSDSNSVCLCYCSGKYNQSISHWQIPIICNFMDEKPIWNQNDPLNVCMQLPKWANYDFLFYFFFHYLLSWNPGDRFAFLKCSWAEKWEKNVWEKCMKTQELKKNKCSFMTKKKCLRQVFFNVHLILQHKVAQTFNVFNCSFNCNVAFNLHAIFSHAGDNKD